VTAIAGEVISSAANAIIVNFKAFLMVHLTLFDFETC
jgi:hypothetical protein